MPDGRKRHKFRQPVYSTISSEYHWQRYFAMFQKQLWRIGLPIHR